MSENALLSIRDLAVAYRTRAGIVEAVRGVSFDVTAGQVTALVGESGSGKSSVAQSVIGLLASSPCLGCTGPRPAVLRRRTGAVCSTRSDRFDRTCSGSRRAVVLP